MFNIAQEPVFTRTVTVQIPHEESVREETFAATFAGVSDDELDEFQLDTAEGTKTFLRRIIVSLGDLADENGDRIPYDEAAREAVIAWPFTRTALARAYFEGLSAAKAGN